MYEYNANRINAAIVARRKMAKLCRDCAKQYSLIPLPESVLHRICTRKKLFNFLEAFDFPAASILRDYGIPVPKDTEIKSRPRPRLDKEERSPAWLENLNKDFELLF